jgi:hypothetical protein
MPVGQNTCSVQLVYKVALVMQEYTQSGGVRSVFNYIKIINSKTVGKVNYSLRILPFFSTSSGSGS